MTIDEEVAQKLGTEVKPYSTKIEVAWEIVEGLCSRDDWWGALRYKPKNQAENGGKWNFIIVDSKDNNQIEEIADTAPLAICRAFMKLEV